MGGLKTGRHHAARLAEGIDAGGSLDGVTISNGQKKTAGPNATLTFTTIRTGTHEISLSSVPAGCVVAGDNPIVVDVHQSEHVNVGFSITCQGNPSS